MPISVFITPKYGHFKCKYRGDPKTDPSKTRNIRKPDFLLFHFQMVVPFENRTIYLVFESLGLKYNNIDVNDVDFGSHLVFTIQYPDKKVLFSNGEFKMANKMT